MQTFSPPQAVRNTARRGLELRRRFGRGGLVKAANLADSDEIPLETIRRMGAFFKRHEGNNCPGQREPDGGPTAGSIAWLLWGGNAGRRWAADILRNEVEKAEQKTLNVSVTKVDDQLGIVFGYAIVCQEDGRDYYDIQGDFIPEESMLRAAAGFMAGRRAAKAQHAGGPVGQVVFGYPLTKDIAAALDIQISRTGFVVGMKPDDADTLEKFATGEFTGFSIGGRRIVDTDMGDA